MLPITLLVELFELHNYKPTPFAYVSIRRSVTTNKNRQALHMLYAELYRFSNI